MRRLFRRSNVIMKIHFIQWKKDSRISILAILTAVLLIRYLGGITSYGLTFNTKATPFLLSIVFCDSTISNGLLKMLVYLGCVCLFCNAPFYTENTSYQLIRCGRNAWWIGSSMYIWIASAIYMLYLMIGVFLVILPTITVTDLWGSTIRDFTSYEVTTWRYIGNLVLPDELIKIIYPWAAQLLTFIAGFLSFVFVGHLIWFLNLLTNKKMPGIAVAVFLIMLDPVVRYLGYGVDKQWMYLWSPINWSSIENWTILGYGHPISMEYAYGMYLIGIICLMFGIAVVNRKKVITTIDN